MRERATKPQILNRSSSETVKPLVLRSGMCARCILRFLHSETISDVELAFATVCLCSQLQLHRWCEHLSLMRNYHLACASQPVLRRHTEKHGDTRRHTVASRICQNMPMDACDPVSRALFIKAVAKIPRYHASAALGAIATRSSRKASEARARGVQGRGYCYRRVHAIPGTRGKRLHVSWQQVSGLAVPCHCTWKDLGLCLHNRRRDAAFMGRR